MLLGDGRAYRRFLSRELTISYDESFTQLYGGVAGRCFRTSRSRQVLLREDGDLERQIERLCKAEGHNQWEVSKLCGSWPKTRYDDDHTPATTPQVYDSGSENGSGLSSVIKMEWCGSILLYISCL